MSDPRLHVRQVQVLGVPAQQTLVGARLRTPHDVTTRDYLERAGVTFDEDGAATSDAGASPEDLVTDPHLADAARALLGAFAAVETIKAATGLGVPGTWPRGLRLDDPRPWLAGALVLTADALADAEAHALAEYPSEACGFLSGPAAEPALADRCARERNEADEYHALDPERFPRTSRAYFKIHELRAARAFDAGEASGRPIKVIYHSHCDSGAHFSAEDAATFASERTLMWPCAFLVVSVVAGAVADRKLWVHSPGTNDFREAAVRVR